MKNDTNFKKKKHFFVENQETKTIEKLNKNKKLKQFIFTSFLITYTAFSEKIIKSKFAKIHQDILSLNQGSNVIEDIFLMVDMWFAVCMV